MDTPRVGTGVMILSEGKVLLGKRIYDEEKKKKGVHGDGHWTFPGGTVEFGESVYECAVRETKEETGIIPEHLKVVAVNDDYNPPVHFVTIGFLAEGYSGELYNAESHKFEKWDWFDLGDLPSPLFRPTAKMLENYIKGEVYLLHNLNK